MTQQPPHPTRPPPKSSVVLDVPCFNCGRLGIFPGQMIGDAYNNTFCSPDCGWSYLLRPIENARLAQAAAGMSANAPTRKRSVKKRPTPPKKEGIRRPPKAPQPVDTLCSSNAMFDYSDMMFQMDAAD